MCYSWMFASPEDKPKGLGGIVWLSSPSGPQHPHGGPGLLAFTSPVGICFLQQQEAAQGVAWDRSAFRTWEAQHCSPGLSGGEHLAFTSISMCVSDSRLGAPWPGGAAGRHVGPCAHHTHPFTCASRA